MKIDVTRTELNRIEDIWLADFHSRNTPPEGNAKRWINTIGQFFTERGDELVPASIRKQEERLMSLGLSREYVAALSKIVPLDSSRNEFDAALLVLTATAEERAQALKVVLG